MVKIWFLLILMSVQDGHPLVYRGILGFDSKEKCLEESVKAENIMFDENCASAHNFQKAELP